MAEKDDKTERVTVDNEQKDFFQAAAAALPSQRKRVFEATSAMTTKNTITVKKTKRLNEIVISGKSLNCISENNKLRIKVGKFVENPYFEAFIFNLIGLNSLFLAIEEPVLEDNYTKVTLELFGNIISSLFIVECAMKIFVMGFTKG